MKKTIWMIALLGLLCTISLPGSLAMDVETAELLFDSAQESFDKKDYGKSKDLCEESLKEDSKFYKAYILLAEIEDAKRRKKKKGEMLLMAYDILNDRSAHSEEEASDFQAINTQLLKIYKTWKDAQKRRTEYVTKLLELAKVEYQEGRRANAVLALEEARKTAPRHEELLQLLKTWQGEIAEGGSQDRAPSLYDGSSLQGWTTESGTWNPTGNGIEALEDIQLQPPYVLTLEKEVPAEFEFQCNILLRSEQRWGSEAVFILRTGHEEFNVCQFVISEKNVTLITTPKPEDADQKIIPSTRGMKIFDEALALDKMYPFTLRGGKDGLQLYRGKERLLSFAFEDPQDLGTIRIALALNKGQCLFIPHTLTALK